jgi:TPR repeat protein
MYAASPHPRFGSDDADIELADPSPKTLPQLPPTCYFEVSKLRGPQTVVAADSERDDMTDRPLGTAGFCVLFSILLVLTGPAFGDPVQDGIAAYERKDFVSAVGFWQPLAEAGNAEAQVKVGSLYATGEGVAQDLAKAVDWFHKSADQGNAEAEWRLSVFYLHGNGPLPRNVPTGLAWLRKATDQNLAAADFTLATVYLAGAPPDVPQDFGEAVIWWRKAADQGMPDAMYQVGRAYNDGRGVPKDGAQAAIWYRKAAEKGHQASQVGLGRLYAEGFGVASDKEQALLWLRKAATQGGASGHIADQLIASLQGGPAPTPLNVPSAIAQATAPALSAMSRSASQKMVPMADGIRAQAEQGDAVSQRALGDLYSLRGYTGSEADADQAMAWWRKAAEQDDVQAMNKLANAYQLGKFVPRDGELSVSWLRKAVEKDDPLAELELGADYANGFGVPKDKDQAIVWFRKADSHGGMFHGMAETAIADLDKVTNPPTAALADFASLLSRASAGDADAQTRLGLIYKDESSSLKDYQEAAVWLSKAAKGLSQDNRIGRKESGDWQERNERTGELA